MPVNQHKIAAGWDNIVGLELVTDLVDAEGNNLHPPRAIGLYDAGTLQPRGDASVTTEGLESVAWLWDHAWRPIRKLFRDSYCGTDLLDHSGKVTIYTPLEDPEEYYTMNVWINIPKLSEISYDGLADWFQGFAPRFVIEEILETP